MCDAAIVCVFLSCHQQRMWYFIVPSPFRSLLIIYPHPDTWPDTCMQEALAAQIENDVARQQVISTDAEALISAAKDQLQQLGQDYEQQQAVVLRYETETRRNATEMQRKQALVDAINRKIDAARQKLIAEGVSVARAFYFILHGLFLSFLFGFFRYLFLEQSCLLTWPGWKW